MKSMKLGFNHLRFAVGAIALLALFQNCSAARFTTDSMVLSERSQGDDGQIAGPQPGDDGNNPQGNPGNDGSTPGRGGNGDDPNRDICDARYSEVVGKHTPKKLCASATTVRFMAGQHYYVGDVSIAIKQGQLLVQISLMGNVVMRESHVDIASSPAELQTSPGQFEFKQNHSPLVSEYIYQISLEGSQLSVGQTIYARVHAAVEPGQNSMLCGGETAWGEGVRSGVGWSMHIPVTIGECSN
ncbi:hypothetical protein [Bdellovibrio sp. HCB337]|uniref:hypothetical protein n=1 Tax=Bdellovibrio sp. HCB337 TaxID=3394358 RepID=UPI0039A69D06